jgi:hypothetical protein
MVSGKKKKPQPPFDDKERLHRELTKDLQRDNVQMTRVSEMVKAVIDGSNSWEDFDLAMQIAMKDQKNTPELNGLLYIRSQARRVKKEQGR